MSVPYVLQTVRLHELRGRDDQVLIDVALRESIGLLVKHREERTVPHKPPKYCIPILHVH